MQIRRHEGGIERAVEVLRREAIILYPTGYGMGIGWRCNRRDCGGEGLSTETFLQQEGHDCADREHRRVGCYFRNVPAVAWDLLECADKPLTLILPGACGVAKNLVPEEGTLAVRVPDHAFCRNLLHRFGRPLVSTSANISGEATPKVRRYCRRDTCGCRLHGRYPLRRRSHPQGILHHHARRGWRSENHQRISLWANTSKAIYRYGSPTRTASAISTT